MILNSCVVGALLAAVPGLIDLVSLPAGPRSTALTHMGINLTVVALFVVNAWMRSGAPDKPGNLVWLSLVSVLLLAVSGWLGGKMVFEHGIGVNTDGPAR